MLTTRPIRKLRVIRVRHGHHARHHDREAHRGPDRGGDREVPLQLVAEPMAVLRRADGGGADEPDVIPLEPLARGSGAPDPDEPQPAA